VIEPQTNATAATTHAVLTTGIAGANDTAAEPSGAGI
jgi:hypothetical protein